MFTDRLYIYDTKKRYPVIITAKKSIFFHFPNCTRTPFPNFTELYPNTACK